MPEVMPCPNHKCGSTDCECLVCTINADESQAIHFHMVCNKCFTSGPIADDAESAKKLWDSMPRALRWTHEPPKVAGWYWCRECKSGVTLCVEVYGASIFLLFGSKRDDFNPQRPVTVDGIEWAGPIASPIG